MVLVSFLISALITLCVCDAPGLGNSLNACDVGIYLAGYLVVVLNTYHLT